MATKKLVGKKIQEKDLNENYKALGNAIVIRAALDYQVCRKDKNILDRKRKLDILRFFRSPMFGLITDINPDRLIEFLDSGVELSEEGMEVGEML